MGVMISKKIINTKKVEYTARWRVYDKRKIVASGQKSGFHTKAEAEKWAEAEFDSHSAVKIISKYTVYDMLVDIVESRKKKIAPSTYNGYKVNIEHMKPYIGELAPVDLTYMHIQKMADSLSENELKEKTVKYIIRTLHACLQTALVKMRVIPYNPCVGIEIKKDDKPFIATTYSFDTMQQLLALLKEMEHELYAPVIISGMLGLRRGEVLALEWAHIDWDMKRVEISKSYNKVKGAPATRTVKSIKSKRTLPMNQTMVDELIWIKQKRESYGRLSRYVCERDDGLRMEASHLSRQLNSFLEANKFPACRFHDLRHSFAMMSVEAGIDIETLSKMLGHSKIGITSEFYTKASMLNFEKAARAIEKKVFKLEDPKKKESEAP